MKSHIVTDENHHTIQYLGTDQFQDSSDDDVFNTKSRHKTKGISRPRRRLSYDSENTSNNSNTSSNSNGAGEQNTLLTMNGRRYREGDREEHTVTVDPVYGKTYVSLIIMICPY